MLTPLVWNLFYKEFLNSTVSIICQMLFDLYSGKIIESRNCITEFDVQVIYFNVGYYQNSFGEF